MSSQTMEGSILANRKQFLSKNEDDQELLALLEAAKSILVSEEILHEQRVSFAFGNAMNLKKVTKDSVRNSSKHIRILA